MDFHQLEYVIAIAEEKSMSKAAKKLYISQPSLSQYIIRLENSLGVKLFDRRGKSLTLSFAGEKYLETAKNILNINKQLKRELSDIAGSKKGRLILGIPSETGRYILPLILPEYHKLFPEIEIVVEEEVTAQLEEMLINGKIDVAILNLPIQQEKILFEPISSERIFLVAPKDHWSCCRKQLKNEKLNFNLLQDEKFILLKQGQRMRLIADEIFKRAQFKPNILLEIKNLDTAHRIAAAGMGFTFVPENVIWLLNTKEYMNYFLIEDMTYNLVIAYKHGEYLTKATREFIDISKKIIDSSHRVRINDNRTYRKVYI